MNRARWSRAGMTIAALALVAGSACSKKAEPPPPPVAVPAPPTPPAFGFVSADLGKAIGADKRVVAPVAVFGVRDTIYVVVQTEGSASAANLVAVWRTAAGQKVDSAAQTIATSGPATSEFHIAKKSAWPVGKYKVEIIVDGKSVATKDFEIAK
ncbi:MAG: hypothetical protein ABI647_15740 [Gemmatimonadota bacterium]